MPELIPCPKCGQQYALRPEMAGRRVQCKKCNSQFVVPGPRVDSDGPSGPVQTLEILGGPVPAAPVAPGVPVGGGPVRGVPVPGVPAQGVPVPGVPVAGVRPGTPVPGGQAGGPGNPPSMGAGSSIPTAGLGPTTGPIIVAARRRYGKSPLAAFFSHPVVLLCIVGVLLAGGAAVAVWLLKDAAPVVLEQKLLPGEEAIRGYIDILNELADVLATIKDEPTAMAAMPKMQSLQKREAELAPKAAEYNKLTEEQRFHLKKKYETRVNEVTARIQKEMDRLAALSGRPSRRMQVRTKAFAWTGPMGSMFGDDNEPEQPPGGMQTTTGGSDSSATRTARVEVLRVPPDAKTFVEERIREAAGDARATFDSGADMISATVSPVADMQALAARIDLGTAKVDAAKGSISIQADPAKFPQPRSPAATNPAHADFVQANLTELRCPDSSRRREAAERLKDATPNNLAPDVARALVAMMSDNNPKNRQAAIEAWIPWKTPASTGDATRILVRMLKEKDTELRAVVFKALGEIKDPQTAPEVAKCLAGFGNDDAKACLIAMGPAAEQAVLPLLSSSDHGARTAAGEILAKVATKQSVPALLELLGQKKSGFEMVEIIRLLAKLKDERATPVMIRLLGDFQTQSQAVEYFVLMGADGERPLLDALDGAEEKTAEGIFAALDRVGTKECTQQVLNVLTTTENFTLRRTGLKILGRLRDPKAIPVLIEMFSNRMVREEAGEIVVKYGPAAEDAAIKGLKHSNPLVRGGCFYVLSKIGTEKSLKELKPLTQARDKEVRQLAIQTVDAITARTSGTGAAPEE